LNPGVQLPFPMVIADLEGQCPGPG